MKKINKKVFQIRNLHINSIIKLTFFVMVVICLLFTAACESKSDGRMQWCEYEVGEQYSEEQGDFIMSRVTASYGITVGETQYDGYYLCVCGVMEMASFTLSSDDFCMFEDLDSLSMLDRETLMVNTELSAMLSEAEMHAGQLYGEASSGNYCLVFDMSENVYNKLYARKDITIDPHNYGYDLEMSIDCLNYLYNSKLCMAEFKISAADIEFI